MQSQSHESTHHCQVPDPLERTFPKLYGPWNMGILGQSAICLRVAGIVKHINDVGAADARRIVDPCVLETRLLSELFRPGLREFFHFRFRAEMQASCGARLDASGLQTFVDPVRT